MVVRNVNHIGYSDLTLFLRNPIRSVFTGAIDPAVMLPLQNDFVRAFFDTHLQREAVDFPAAQFATYSNHAYQERIDDIRPWWLEKHPQDRVERVVLETDRGEVELALYPERAPVSASNFLAYVDGGHFDGAEFYRVTSFERDHGIAVVQGGLAGAFMRSPPKDPSSIESTLPPIAHETTTQTGISNEAATVAFARLDPGTANSEFFINMGDNLILDTGDTSGNTDGQGFATFGRVLRGMGVLRAIQSLPAEAPVPVEMLQGQILSKSVKILRVYRAADPE